MSPERRRLIRIFLGVQLFLGIGALIGQINFHLTEGTARDRLYFVPYLLGFGIASFIYPFFPAYRKAKFQGGGDLFAPLTYFLGILVLPLFVLESYKPLFETLPTVSSVTEVRKLPNRDFHFENLQPRTDRIEDIVQYAYKENKNKNYADYKNHFNYQGMVPLVVPKDSSQVMYLTREEVHVRKGEFDERSINRISDSLRIAFRQELMKFPFERIQYFKKADAPGFYDQKPGQVFVKASVESYWSANYPTVIAMAVLWVISFLMFWFSVRFGDSSFDSD
jgi:hypothetical protein